MCFINLSGFGAMVLQFAAHYAVIRLTKWICSQILEMVANKPSTKVSEFYHLDSSIQSTPMDGGSGKGNEADPESNTLSRSISSLSVE